MVRLTPLQNLGHVADLFHSLGYTRHLEQTADEVWTVARWKGYRVAAMYSKEPRTAAIKMAKGMVAQSQRSLAVAISPTNEISFVAPRIGVPGVTRALSIVTDAATTFELHKLELLRPADGTTALAHSLRVAEVLDSEPVGDRFFTAFRVIFERMVASRRDIPEVDVRSLVLLSLVRVIFLYFVQAKGWLDGRYDYIRTLFDRSLQSRKKFHSEVLSTLFFGSLNVPQEERSDDDFGAIPYLNGGLFERNPVELRWPEFDISNEIWRDALDELFERFQFCVTEARELDAIAPDMLGRVFERLGEPDREATGTYYTPEIIVTQIVAFTLETALLGRGGMDATRARACVAGKPLTRDVDELRIFLANLKLLDPAVGSGAFLLGALHALSAMWLAVAPEMGLQKIRRQIMRNNLFGVDQSPVAVKLAELRLWLALIADDPTTEIGKIEPLPNLNGIIRQGDTLIDPFAPAGPVLSDSSSSEVGSARDFLFSARGKSLHERMQALRKAEHNLAVDLLRQAMEAADRKTAELESITKGNDLFGKQRKLDAGELKQLKRFRALKREMVSKLGAVNDGRIPFFSFEVHAPDIMKRGGFDVVIGNPPWVRAEKLSPQFREILRDRFKWWRGSKENGYAHLPDLSVAFLERAFQLVAPEGAIGLLVPSKLLSANYSEVARAHIVRECTITYLHRVPENQASRFGATTYPLAIVAKLKKPHPRSLISVGFASEIRVLQKRFEEKGPWLLHDSPSQEAIHQLRQSGVALRELSTPQLGVKTGANRVFIGKLLMLGRKTSLVKLGDEEVEIESEIVRPVLRGRDVNRFRQAPERVLLYPYDANGTIIRNLPPLASSYFRKHRPVLENRADYKHEPYWSLFRTKPVMWPFLVVWADIAREPRALVVERNHLGVVPLNSCYVCGFTDSTRAHCMATVFNSLWVEVLSRAEADEARGGYRRFNARVAGSIPIPTDKQSVRRLAALSTRAHESGDYDQAEVDLAVAEALQLTPETQRTLKELSNCR